MNAAGSSNDGGVDVELGALNFSPGQRQDPPSARALERSSMSHGKLVHPCSFTITYAASCTGTASERERRELAQIYEGEAPSSLPNDHLERGAQCGHSGLVMAGEVGQGELVPIHAAVSIGH